MKKWGDYTTARSEFSRDDSLPIVTAKWGWPQKWACMAQFLKVFLKLNLRHI